MGNRNVCEKREPENKTTMLAMFIEMVTTTGTQPRQSHICSRETGMCVYMRFAGRKHTVATSNAFFRRRNIYIVDEY